MTTATESWVKTLDKILTHGRAVSPRGRLTRECQQCTFTCDMNFPVVQSAERGLSYKFMAAEALWILAGDDTVAGIAPYNARIAAFSDDGKTFFGAYGPRVVGQLNYVVRALAKDRDTRQAVLTTWRPCPPATKDVPCTVAMAFMIRAGLLNCHVFMRSSDVWLGLPYDAFNFSMVAARVACAYNSRRPSPDPVELGALYLTAASSHLYEENFDGAQRCLAERNDERSNDGLRQLVLSSDWRGVESSLIACRDNHDDQWAHAWAARPARRSS